MLLSLDLMLSYGGRLQQERTTVLTDNPPDPYKLKKDQFFEIGMFCINMMKHSKETIISRILSVKNTGFLDANLLQFHFHIT